MNLKSDQGYRNMRMLLGLIAMLAAVSILLHISTRQMLEVYVASTIQLPGADAVARLLTIQTWLHGATLILLALLAYAAIRPLADWVFWSSARLRYLARMRHRARGEDRLTGLPDRVRLKELVADDLVHNARHGHALALLRLDVDGLREINERQGEKAGDSILEEIALRLRRISRRSDRVARLGGTEFAIVVPEIRTVEGLGVMADRIIAEIEDGFAEQGELTGSVGIAVSWPDRPETGDRLMTHADDALARAVAAGGSTWRYHPSALQGLNDRIEVVAS